MSNDSYRGVAKWLRYGVMKGAQVDKYLRGKHWRPVIKFFYRLIAPIYDSATSKLLDDYQEVAKQLLHNINLEKTHALLDLGCGTGVLSLPASKISYLSVGIDLSAGMLRQLVQKRQTQQPFILKGNVLHLPVADKSFDRIVTAFMLLHLNEEEKTLLMVEAFRVLKLGGYIGCLSSRETIANVYTSRERWHQLFDEAGFVNVNVKEVRDVYQYITAHKL